MQRIASACVLATCCLFAGFMLNQPAPTVAQAPAANAAVGRYQVSMAKDMALFLDTQTGKCWVGIPALMQFAEKGKNPWTEIPSPVAKK